MAKKRESPNQIIINQSLSGDKGYYMGEDTSKVVASLNAASKEYTGVQRTEANYHRMGFSPSDVGGSGVDGRYGMTHADYEAWRPNEKSIFKDVKEAILHSDMCYRRHGIIKNVIDIMGDFGSQGIRLVHPNKRIEKFFQNWFRRVNGVERSERFLNNLYRLGNVVVRVQTAKISQKNKEKLFRARAADIELVDLKVTSNEIPWKFSFLHPALVNVVGGSLSNFTAQPQYTITLPRNLSNAFKNPQGDQKFIIDQLPPDIRRAAQTNKPIPLPQDKTKVYHYKKDDWQEWAFPMISSISTDISMYDKLKLADRAALDGAISNIRIFKLGDIDANIFPGPEAINTLADILQSNTSVGTIDLIWGPDIELIESNTNVYQFLGQEKYEPTLIAIYAGLGIPPTLTGTFGASGTTNNFISLKTLTQRLEYGRDVLVKFWDEQIKIVQEAMGFRFPARVEFDLMNLGDEVAEKALLVQLADRNLISDELLQRYFGSDPDMERIRTNSEKKERDNERRVEKAGPFYDPQVEEALKKVALQGGSVTPSEVGLELEPRKSGEQPALKMRQPTGVGGKPPAKKGVPQQGRPKNSKDSTTRQKKTFKPKTKASVMVWASEAQSYISDIINPVILKQYNKKNMRSLSQEEIKTSEEIKFGVLCQIPVFAELTEKEVFSAISKKIPNKLINVYDNLEKAVSAELGRDLVTHEKKQLQISIYYDLISEELDG